jgi:hypothetical protein
VKVWVTVENNEELVRLANATMTTQEALSNALAETAFFHANAVLGALPDAVKGKLNVEIMSATELSAQITYQMKAGPEGATATTGKMFLPLDKMGSGTSRKPVISSGGEQGVFVTGLTTIGRTSIQKYLMIEAEKAVEKADSMTLDVAVESARRNLLEWFTANGINYNSVAGRFQASRTTTMPWGQTIGGGSFIAGDF